MLDNKHSLFHIIYNKNSFISVRVYISDQQIFLHAIENQTQQKFKSTLNVEDLPSLKVFNSNVNLFKIMSKLTPNDFILRGQELIFKVKVQDHHQEFQVPLQRIEQWNQHSLNLENMYLAHQVQRLSSTIQNLQVKIQGRDEEIRVWQRLYQNVPAIYREECEQIKEQPETIKMKMQTPYVKQQEQTSQNQTQLQQEYQVLLNQFKFLQDKYFLIEQHCRQLQEQIQTLLTQKRNESGQISKPPSLINFTNCQFQVSSPQYQLSRSKPSPSYIKSDKLKNEVSNNLSNNALSRGFPPKQLVKQYKATHGQNNQKVNREKNKNGHNSFLFKPFTLSKSIGMFDINEQRIKMKDEEEDRYFQVISLYPLSTTGTTKIGFKVISCKYKNIIVGVMLSGRRRTGYSFQQAWLISYKIRGGKGCLYQDGNPAGIETEEVGEGQCLWMTLDMQKMTIEWAKQFKLVRPLLPKFQNKELFPFITMKNKGDEIQII